MTALHDLILFMLLRFVKRSYVRVKTKYLLNHDWFLDFKTFILVPGVLTFLLGLYSVFNCLIYYLRDLFLAHRALTCFNSWLHCAVFLLARGISAWCLYHFRLLVFKDFILALCFWIVGVCLSRCWVNIWKGFVRWYRISMKRFIRLFLNFSLTSLDHLEIRLIFIIR